MRPKIPTEADATRPAVLSFTDLPDVVNLRQVCDATSLDKKTILAAIHSGRLPAWFPGGNAVIGFRLHRRDAEAWFFSDPTLAHTPGVGSPAGPRREGIDQYQAESR